MRSIVIRAQSGLEGIETLLPEAGVIAEPCICAGERCGFEPADVRAAAYRAPEEAAALQCLDVLGCSSEGHAEGRGQLADGPLASGQSAQHLAPCRVG